MQYHPAEKLKRTCPALTQLNKVTRMWSGEEGSHSSSGQWFPLCGLPLPRPTPCRWAAPWDAPLPTPRLDSRCMGTQPLLPPDAPLSTGPRVQIQDPLSELRDVDARESCSFPLSGLHFHSSNSIVLPSPCPPLPPDPCSEQHSLILSRGPTSCPSQLWVLAVTCDHELWHFLCYEFTLLSS